MPRCPFSRLPEDVLTPRQRRRTGLRLRGDKDSVKEPLADPGVSAGTANSARASVRRRCQARKRGADCVSTTVLIVQKFHGGLGGLAEFAANVAAEEVGEEQSKSGRRRDLAEAESDQRDEDSSGDGDAERAQDRTGRRPEDRGHGTVQLPGPPGELARDVPTEEIGEKTRHEGDDHEPRGKRSRHYGGPGKSIVSPPQERAKQQSRRDGHEPAQSYALPPDRPARAHARSSLSCPRPSLLHGLRPLLAIHNGPVRVR